MIRKLTPAEEVQVAIFALALRNVWTVADFIAAIEEKKA